nr:hypothetical protein [Brevibacillus laterosporus]
MKNLTAYKLFIWGGTYQRSIVCTLETQNPGNIALYERYQFTTIEVIPLPESKLEQYCMVYQ